VGNEEEEFVLETSRAGYEVRKEGPRGTNPEKEVP
jgi:hypothetical protein